MYAANMGFGYSSDRWGTASGAALTANLRSIDAVQFSRSSNLYGSLDNDDTYQYVGGLRTAIAQAAVHAPEVFLHDLRQNGAEKMVSLREWLAVELHSRQFNPTWLREMQKSGYAGAREMSKEIEHLYGFQKTAPDHLDSRTWHTVLDVFVKDTYRLGLQRFFEEHNPHARQTMLARLLEVDRQGIHHFSTGDRQMLLTEYARSVATSGAACNAQICGNAVLRQHVAQELRRSGRAAAAVTMDAAFRRTLTKTATTVAARRTVPPRRDRAVEWRSLATYVTSWPRTWPLPWKDTAVPWWVWLGFACGHVAAAALLARTRRRTPEAPITLL
jgi:cobaltochelatase CobN